jgi:hypothetical protein
MQQQQPAPSSSSSSSTTSSLNKHERKKVIVSSSDGKNAKGGHVLTPTSVISYRFADPTTTATATATATAGGGEVFKARATDTVRFLMNPLWSCEVKDVLLPIQSLFDYVPFDPALIRHWIQCKEYKKMGALMFPRQYQDSESLEPVVQVIRKSTLLPGSASISADVTVSIFRRAIVECADLQPFDASVWHSRSSYNIWCYFHHRFAVTLEEAGSDLLLDDPSGGSSSSICEFFRRMMHTHFADCGFVFGKLWCDFGFADMVEMPLRIFMFNMLMEMFARYYNNKNKNKNKVADEKVLTTTTTTATLPPLFNASTIKGSGQHICAKCLTYKLGSGKMMRCPCREVFYCCRECQKKDWKVHRLVCEAAAGEAARDEKKK